MGLISPGAINASLMGSGAIASGSITNGTVVSGMMASGQLCGFHMQSGIIVAGVGITVTYSGGIFLLSVP